MKVLMAGARTVPYQRMTFPDLRRQRAVSAFGRANRSPICGDRLALCNAWTSSRATCAGAADTPGFCTNGEPHEGMDEGALIDALRIVAQAGGRTDCGSETPCECGRFPQI